MKNIILFILTFFIIGFSNVFAYDHTIVTPTLDTVEWDDNSAGFWFNSTYTVCNASQLHNGKITVIQKPGTTRIHVMCGHNGIHVFESGNTTGGNLFGNQHIFGIDGNECLFVKHNTTYFSNKIDATGPACSASPTSQVSDTTFPLTDPPFPYQISESPTQLTDGHIVDVDSLENGVRVNFSCDLDCEVQVGLYSEDETLFYGSNLQTFSGGTNSIDITPVSLLYQQDYKVLAVFTDINNPLVEFLDNTIFTYWYDSTPNDYTIGDFTFSSFGFERLSNGFEITDLDVNNIGGQFWLKIVGPNGYGTGEYLTHDIYKKHQSVELGGYGSGSIIQVTYPYHQFPGDYELLIAYNYSGVGTMYPYGTGVLNYSITEPEWRYEESELFLCDTNSDGIIDDTERDECRNEVEGSFLENVGGFLNGIKRFFSELMKIGDVEPKEWGFNFVPTTYADTSGILPEMNMEDDNFLTDTYTFLRGFIIFAFLVLGVSLIILILRKE